MDIHSPKIRSFNMSQIKAKNTKPEILVRKFLHKNGFRFRVHERTLPGKPDIVLKKYKTVILIHGCFWHGHENCKYFVIPKTRTEWWKEKISGNKKRDEENVNRLIKLDWQPLIIWECNLKNNRQSIFDYLLYELNQKTS